MNLRLILPPLLCLSTLVSCGRLGLGETEVPEEGPWGRSGIPPELRAGRNRTPAGGGQPVTVDPSTVDITPDSEIFFTNPDNPDDLPEELSVLLSAPRDQAWEQSETIAKRRAAREGKPLLIWFTDSQSSPLCKTLNRELFGTPVFEEWAEERLIRLKVDTNVQVDGSQEFSLERGQLNAELTLEIERKNHIRMLKKRYKVLGHPSVLMLNPSGEVIGRYRGFRSGEAAYFWGLIKHGEAAGAASYRSWRAELERRGYRDWSDRRGRSIFAKLERYSGGSLILIEPDGTRARTTEGQLSDADREWIAEQKRLRGQS